MPLKKLFDWLSGCWPFKRSASSAKNTTFYSQPNAPLAPLPSLAAGQGQRVSQGMPSSPNLLTARGKLTTASASTAGSPVTGSPSSSAVSVPPEPAASKPSPAPISSNASAPGLAPTAATSTALTVHPATASAAVAAPLVPGLRNPLPDPHTPPPDMSHHFSVPKLPRGPAAPHINNGSKKFSDAGSCPASY